RLAHFFHATEIAGIAIAVFADRNIKLEFRIAFVGLGFAEVPSSTRAAQHDPREPPSPSIVQAHHRNIDVALLKNTILREQDFQVVAYLEERVAKIPNVIDKFRWQVLMHAADAKIVGMHPRAGGALIEHH